MLRFALLAVVPLLFAPVTTAQTVTGTLTSAADAPLPAAHAHAFVPGGEAPVATVSVGPDGRFALATGRDGFVVLRFTGANHRPVDLPLYVGDGEEVDLTVRLAVNPLLDNLSDLRVRGDFAGAGRTLKPQPDGTFAETFPARADTFAYQLTGGFVHGPRVNGTDWDRLVFDGGSDYIAVLDAPGDSVTVTFDPRLVPAAESLPSVDFAERGTRAARSAAVLRDLDNRSELVFEARRRAIMATRGVPPEDRQAALDAAMQPFDLSAEDARLAAAADAETDPAVRQAILLNYVSVETEPAQKDPALALRALRDLGPDAPLWGLYPALVQRTLDLARLGDPAAAERSAQEFYDVHPDPDVQAYALLHGLDVADRAGQEGRAQGYFALLQEERFAETDPGLIAEALFGRYDLTGGIHVGAPVPDFSLQLLDAEGTVSRASLLGRPYLIDFWAVWCSPCVAEMPNLHATYDRYRERGFDILSISMDDTPAEVRAFRAERFPMPWLNVFSEEGFGGDLAERFEVGSLPKPILVGADGRIVAEGSDLRGANLGAALEQLFTEAGQ
ncbi:MAG: TlpA disulfide reductase family protein [Rhodothermales bacterium]